MVKLCKHRYILVNDECWNVLLGTIGDVAILAARADQPFSLLHRVCTPYLWYAELDL